MSPPEQPARLVRVAPGRLHRATVTSRKYRSYQKTAALQRPAQPCRRSLAGAQPRGGPGALSRQLTRGRGGPIRPPPSRAAWLAGRGC